MTEHVFACDVEPEPVHPRGPFDQEPRVPGLRDREQRRQILAGALDGVALGAWDEVILNWLNTWETSTLLTIAGWLWRARTAANISSQLPNLGSDNSTFDRHSDPDDPVRYAPVTAPTVPPLASRARCPICGAEPPSPRATYCSDAHRQLAYRLRQGAPQPPPRKPPRHQVVYQCPNVRHEAPLNRVG